MKKIDGAVVDVGASVIIMFGISVKAKFGQYAAAEKFQK